jgi:hypothetical protein
MDNKFILISISLDNAVQDVMIDLHSDLLLEIIMDFFYESVLPYESIDLDSMDGLSASEFISHFEIEFEGINSDIKYSIHVLDSNIDKYVKLSKQMIREFINLNYDLIKDNLLKKMYDSGNYK